MLLNLTIADYPHSKTYRRAKIHREIHNMAYPVELRPKSVGLTTSQVFDMVTK